MQGEPIIYLIIAIITALGSSAAWKFYSDWRIDRREDNTHYSRYIKEDYKKRIDSLESQLFDTMEEKDVLWKRVLDLEIQFSEVNVKLVYLEQENINLKAQLKSEHESNLRLMRELKESQTENNKLMSELMEVRAENSRLLEELNKKKDGGDDI